MATKQILAYYDATADRETRPDLKLAIELVDGPRIAVDCGCGSGSDIAFLRARGFVVHAFDIESESIARCRRRFSDDENVFLSQDNFIDFDYPVASLVLADASLFFCPPDQFDEIWRKMTEALTPGGIFVGSFLGPDDTMAGPDHKREDLWPDVLVVSERQIRSRFSEFEIVSWTEHKTSGATAEGRPHQWHVFSLVARKLATDEQVSQN